VAGGSGDTSGFFVSAEVVRKFSTGANTLEATGKPTVGGHGPLISRGVRVATCLVANAEIAIAVAERRV